MTLPLHTSHGPGLSVTADIYSVGLVAWELCTGQCPFDGMNSGQIVAAVVLRGERPPLPANMTNEQATLLQR